VSKLASLLMEDMLRMLMEAHGVAHGPEGGMADLGRALGMFGTDEDCRDLDDNPDRLQPDLIPGVVVRVRQDVTSPSFGWGAVTHDQIGVLRSRNQQDECKVAFESVGQGSWNCRANELEVVPSAENLCYTLPDAVLRRGDDGLRIGSAVRVRTGLDRPRGGWGNLEDHRHAVGRIVGMRTAGQARPALSAERAASLSVRELKAELRARGVPLAGLAEKSDLLGALTLALEAAAPSARVTTVLVAFPLSVGTWKAAPDELEAWDGDSTIKVGVCVQVRPGLERPRCDWPDGVDHSTVGLVRRVLSHGLVKVEFPSVSNSWFAFDLDELTPSAADAPPPPSAGTAPAPPPVPVPAPTPTPAPTPAPTLVATAREYCVYVRTTVATPGSETERKVRARACPCSLRMLAPQGAHTLRNARLGRSSECFCHVFLDILRRSP